MSELVGERRGILFDSFSEGKIINYYYLNEEICIDMSPYKADFFMGQL
jgi:hypothetical protein